MTSVPELLDRLVAACGRQTDDALIAFRTQYEPAGGPGTKVMPPTYPDASYVLEERVLEDEQVRVVLLDSFQSQANRVEEALLHARDDGLVPLPLIELRTKVGDRELRLTSFDFPHRYADAYLRDSVIGGVRFDKTSVGSELRSTTAENVSPLYRRDPDSLVFGAWDSHRAGRHARFPRLYRSEVIGVDPVMGDRRAGRMDPLNLIGQVDDSEKAEADWEFVAGSEKAKGGRLSEIGHGNVAPGPQPGGVTFREARRLGSLSFAGLARLQFGDASATAAIGARAVLAALALLGDRLTFGGPSLWLRSGCELVVTKDIIAFQGRNDAWEPISLAVSDAMELFRVAQARAADAGLEMGTETVVVEPYAALQRAIEYTFAAAPAEEE